MLDWSNDKEVLTIPPENHKTEMFHNYATDEVLDTQNVEGLAIALAVVASTKRESQSDDLSEVVRRLLSHSMLHRARQLAKTWKNDGSEWIRPYGLEHSNYLFEEKGDVWLDLYPASIIPQTGESVVGTLAQEELWKALKAVGITVIHTNPMRLSGGITPDGKNFTPSTDGGYDRIALGLDPFFGTDDEYRNMAAQARAHGALVADDIVPGHTGTGADWQLALLNYEDYPSLYHMIEIPEAYWKILPDVPAGKDSVNLSEEVVKELSILGFVDGEFDEVIFKAKGVKETNWSAKGPITGVDGITRRWVYLHLFKEGQPTLNWLAPSHAAQQMLTGDLMVTLRDFGARIVRLDANSLLGTERVNRTGLAASSRLHPLSAVATQGLAMMARKLGGYTYEENSQPMKTLREMGYATAFGPDLNYDFTTRGGYIYALLSGNAELLRLEFSLMVEFEVGSGRRALHSMQNHDELFIKFPYDMNHPNLQYTFGGQKLTGPEINDFLEGEGIKYGKEYHLTTGEYGGISSTFPSLLAGRLGIDAWNRTTEPLLSPEEHVRLRDAMIFAAAYNVLQPGFFQLSAWDLLGAFQLNPEDVDPALLADGDTRWLNRPSYDLMGVADANALGVTGLPRARTCFGSIPDQLRNPSSFISVLRFLLKVREQEGIATSTIDLSPQHMVEGLGSSVLTFALHPHGSKDTLCPRALLVVMNFGFEEASLDLDLSARVGFLNIFDDQPIPSEQWPNVARTVDVNHSTLHIALPPLQARLIRLMGADSNTR